MVDSALSVRLGVPIGSCILTARRIHQYNTEDLLLAFLPYHSTPLFLTLADTIDTDRVPEPLRFLRPYIAKSVNPPVHSIVQAASTTPAFLSAFNRQILRLCRQYGYSSAILSFWSSVVVQAVDRMLVTSQSGIDTVRKQRLGQVYDQILPMIRDALAIKDVPELAVSTCMIATVLAARGNLNDEALDAIMESIASNWNPISTDARLVSLAIISQERGSKKLSRSVAKRLLALEGLIDRLKAISESYNVDRLSSGIALRILSRFPKSTTERELVFISELFGSGILDSRQLKGVMKEFVLAVNGAATTNSSIWSEHPHFREGLVSIIAPLKDSSVQVVFEKSLKKNNANVHAIELALQTVITSETDQSETLDAVPQEIFVQSRDALTEEIKVLSDIPFEKISFLQDATSELFDRFSSPFRHACITSNGLSSFYDIPALGRSKIHSNNHATFLTFLARAWSSSLPKPCRVEALSMMTAMLADLNKSKIDLNFVLPYVLFALNDESPQVRRAAAKCLLALEKTLGTQIRSASQPQSMAIYSSTSTESTELNPASAQKFIRDALLTDLEKCTLDGGAISRSLRRFLSGKAKDEKKHKKSKRLSDAMRFPATELFAEHAALTPLLNVKQWLMEILGQLGKSGSTARSKWLFPAFEQWLLLPSDEVESACRIQGVALPDLNLAFLRFISSGNEERLKLLVDLVTGQHAPRQDMIAPAYDRLYKIWGSLKDKQRNPILQQLVEFVLRMPQNNLESECRDHALAFLRKVDYSTPNLLALLESLPDSVHLPAGPTPKRRRTSRTEMAKFELNPTETVSVLGKYQLVLELVDEAGPGTHSELLKPLFHVLGELQGFGLQTNQSLVYLRVLVLNALLAIVDNVKVRDSSASIPKVPLTKRIDRETSR
jgi:U3 small nucleolar RNA-associated protein 10